MRADDVRTGPVLRSRVVRPEPSGLRRPRLVSGLLGRAAPPLGALVAGPGHGKTTLLAQAAAATRDPVAWVTLDAGLGAAALLAHLRAACGTLPWRTGPGAWRTVDDAVADLGEGLAEAAVLVLDDVHAVGGGCAEQVVGALLRHQPAGLRVLLGSRVMPVGVARRELAGTALVLRDDALRLRAWEVAELFRVHAQPLSPDEADALTRSTGGWPAGVALFRRAVEGRPASSRAVLLRSAGRGPGVAAYLAGHVLDGVPADVRDLLVRTSPLGRLSGDRCDALLGSDTAGSLLAVAHRHGVLTAHEGPEGTWFECHEVLRGHLLDLLGERGGDGEALHRRAAAIASRDGLHEEAVGAACRAGDLDGVRRALRHGGAALAARPGPWLDRLPAEVRGRDPWVALAVARRRLGDGALDAALAAYAVAAERADPGAARARVVREARQVRAWAEPTTDAPDDWVAWLRATLSRPERVPVDRRRGAGGLLAAAAAGLVAGDVRVAAGDFAAAQAGAGGQRLLEAVALLGQATCLTLMGEPGAHVARERARTAAGILGAPALERLADGLDPESGAWLRARATGLGDAWGAALLGLLDVAKGQAAGRADARLALHVAAELRRWRRRRWRGGRGRPSRWRVSREPSGGGPRSGAGRRGGCRSCTCAASAASASTWTARPSTRRRCVRSTRRCCGRSRCTRRLRCSGTGWSSGSGPGGRRGAGSTPCRWR